MWGHTGVTLGRLLSSGLAWICAVLLSELFQLLILTLSSQICSLFVPHIRGKIKDCKQECYLVYFAKKNHRILQLWRYLFD